MSRCAGVDFHRCRSQVVILDEDGEKVSSVKVDNGDPVGFVAAVSEAGEGSDVVLGATWGWYWAVDLLMNAGFRVHLAHLFGVKGFQNRRVRNDDRDATLLADLLRMGSLPEAWIAPPELRRLCELVRYRHKLCELRSGLKSQVHAVLGKEGVIPQRVELWGPAGARWLDDQQLADAYQDRVVAASHLTLRHGTHPSRP